MTIKQRQWIIRPNMIIALSVLNVRPFIFIPHTIMLLMKR